MSTESSQQAVPQRTIAGRCTWQWLLMAQQYRARHHRYSTRQPSFPVAFNSNQLRCRKIIFPWIWEQFAATKRSKSLSRTVWGILKNKPVSWATWWSLISFLRAICWRTLGLSIAMVSFAVKINVALRKPPFRVNRWVTSTKQWCRGSMALYKTLMRISHLNDWVSDLIYLKSQNTTITN